VKEPSPPTDVAGDDSRPAWFEAFLADRGTRKPSEHTMKAYRQDFDAIATLIVGEHEPVAGMPLSAISTDQLRTGFAGYAETHEAAAHRASPTRADHEKSLGEWPWPRRSPRHAS
jgi:hypothetical protein